MKGKNDPQREDGGANYLSFILGSGGDHERTHIRESLQKLSKPEEDVKTFDDGEANDEVDADFWYAKYFWYAKDLN